MTSLITPNPSIHSDPLAPQEQAKQLQETKNAVHQMFAGIIPQIIELIVNTILGALGLKKIEGRVDDLLNALDGGMKNIPGANVTGTPAGIQSLVDGVVGGGTGHPLQALIDGLISGLKGPIDHHRLHVVPVGHVAVNNTNLFPGGSFDNASEFDGQAVWSWDGTVDHTGKAGSGSVKMTANGQQSQTIYSDEVVAVSQGDTFQLDAYVQWTGVTAVPTGAAFQLQVIQYLNGVVLSPLLTVAQISNPAASGTFDANGHLSGTYTVPSGVDSVRLAVTVTYNVLAGTVWVDDLSGYKNGLMQHHWMKGIATTIGQDLQDAVDGIVSMFGGTGTHSGRTQSDANNAMGGIFNTVVQNQNQVQQLQITALGASVGGYVDIENWAAMPNSSTVPNFNTIYGVTGPSTGTSTIGITNGAAHWNVSGSDTRSALLIYTPSPTLTDYQSVRATVNSGPQLNGAANYLIARCDEAGQNFVYIKFTQNSFLAFYAEMGCFVGGTKNIWVPAVQIPVSTGMELFAGTALGINEYQLIVGGQVVIDYTDSANQAVVGSNNRYWGFAGDVVNGNAPGDGVSMSVADHQPPVVPGSTMKAVRISSSVASGTAPNDGNSNYLAPANFLDSVSYISDDLTWLPNISTTYGNVCGVQVSKPGTYTMTCRIKVGRFVNGQGGYGLAWKLPSGSTVPVIDCSGPWADCPGSTNSVNVSNSDAMFMSLPLLLQAGDVVIPGVYSNSALSPQGGSNGTWTYMVLALANPG